MRALYTRYHREVKGQLPDKTKSGAAQAASRPVFYGPAFIYSRRFYTRQTHKFGGDVAGGETDRYSYLYMYLPRGECNYSWMISSSDQ